MEFKNKISVRRYQLGLTLDYVAKAVGVSESTISRWESGNIKNMRRDKIEKLAQVLSLSPLYLLDIDESKPKPKPIILTKDEEQLLEGYRMMEQKHQSYILETVNILRPKSRSKQKEGDCNKRSTCNLPSCELCNQSA